MATSFGNDGLKNYTAIAMDLGSYSSRGNGCILGYSPFGATLNMDPKDYQYPSKYYMGMGALNVN